MCRVCAARAAKSSTKALRAAQIKALREFQATPDATRSKAISSAGCLETLDFYKSINTTGWTDFEKSIVKSQIKNYDSKCNLYYDKIQDILRNYSEALPSSTTPLEEHNPGQDSIL